MPQANQIDKPIYLALYTLIQYLYHVVSNFPKEYKYTLGSDILALAWRTLDFVVLANAVENSEKHKYIGRAVSVFNSLKFRLRLSSELKILNHRSYACIIKQSISINKMLRGWFAWSKKI